MAIFSLAGKTAIVTGGSRGIGSAVVKTLKKQGARVHILDLQPPPEGPEGISFHSCDITREEVVAQTFDKVAGDSGLDILINNAGIAHIGNVENTSPAEFDRVFDVNVRGAFYCMAAAVKHMKKNGGGSIVNMASVAAMVGLNDRFAYSASKGAILSMTYSVAKDYIKDNIRVNSISPGRVHTPFVDGFLKENYPGQEEEMFEKLSKTQPIGRMGNPEEIALLVLYLCSDESAFITGSNYTIDGGLTNLNT